MSYAAHGMANPSQLTPYQAEMGRRLRRKRQHLEPGRELLDGLKVLAPARRFLDAVKQLTEGDRRDAEPFEDARSVYKKLAPTPTNRGNQPAIAEPDDLYLMHPLGKRHCLGEPNGLAGFD